ACCPLPRRSLPIWPRRMSLPVKREPASSPSPSFWASLFWSHPSFQARKLPTCASSSNTTWAGSVRDRQSKSRCCASWLAIAACSPKRRPALMPTASGTSGPINVSCLPLIACSKHRSATPQAPIERATPVYRPVSPLSPVSPINRRLRKLRLRYLVSGCASVDGWQNQVSIDVVAVFDGKADQRGEDGTVEQVRLQAQFDQSRVRGIVIVLLCLDTRIREVPGMHF